MKKLISIAGGLLLPFLFAGLVSANGNLVANGSFETPEVTDPGFWQIFDNTLITPWTVSGVPDPGDTIGLEYQENGISIGSTASQGDQYVELDSYYPVTLTQPITACQNGSYDISFDYAPRPGHSENKLKAEFGTTVLLDTPAIPAPGTFAWTHFSQTVAGPTVGSVVLSFKETGTNDQLGMFLDNVVVACSFVRSAVITSPAPEGVEVSGVVSFDAVLNDKDGNDSVQWAVRKGTCAAGTGTVFGNVDGYNDTFTWDGYNFHASADTTSWELGMYCFVFNPTESAGDAPIRLTRNFVVIDPDTDLDGITDRNDKCAETGVDTLDGDLGVNRWMWDGNSWKTVKSKGTGPSFSPPFAYTYGCSCIQILDEISEKTGGDFGGHYKFGCSKSILEDWNRGTYHIGKTLIETITVPASSSTGVSSLAILDPEKDYFLKAYGTGMACNQPGCVITFDAEYSTSDGGLNWVDGVAAPYNIYGADLLDLKVDGAFVNWGVYNTLHTYEIPYPGTGSPVQVLLGVYDLAGSYFNDTGNILVDLIEDKWVDLW